MGRAILAVIAGYIAMFIIVFVGLSIAFIAMGIDRAYQPGSYEVSTSWIVVMLIIGLGAALAGGCMCRFIAKRPKPVVALAALVLIFGGLSAGFEMMERAGADDAAAVTKSEVRTEDVSITEAMVKSKQPIWIMWANAAIGVIGVLVGGGRKMKPETTEGEDD